MQISKNKGRIAFVVMAILLMITVAYSTMTGSVAVSIGEFIQGICGNFSENLKIVIDLRLPRIVIAIIAGCGIATGGVLLQSAMRNHLADAGILGINSGAMLMSVITAGLFPSLFFFSPLFAFIGGMGTFIMVYSLARQSGVNIMRIIIIGVIVNMVFTALSDALQSVRSSGNALSQYSLANLSMKTWEEVVQLGVIVAALLIIAIIIAPWCDILGLDDRAINSLGVNIVKIRFGIAVLGVAIASICTAFVGNIGFLGLIAPFIGRKFVGNKHRMLLPFSMVCGAFFMVLGDTVGRLIAAPNEIGVGLIMAVVGGPCFILMLRRSKVNYGK